MICISDLILSLRVAEDTFEFEIDWNCIILT